MFVHASWRAQTVQSECSHPAHARLGNLTCLATAGMTATFWCTCLSIAPSRRCAHTTSWSSRCAILQIKQQDYNRQSLSAAMLISTAECPFFCEVGACGGSFAKPRGRHPACGRGRPLQCRYPRGNLAFGYKHIRPLTIALLKTVTVWG